MRNNASSPTRTAIDNSVSGSRVIYFDLLRIFSILFMMLLHVSVTKWQDTPPASFTWNVLNVYDSLSRFCVPVFLMISGALFLDPRRRISIKRLYTHNILRIVTAFVFWSVIYAFADVFLCGEKVNGVAGFFRLIVFGHYHMWFLYVIAMLYMLIPLCRKIAADSRLLRYFLLLWAAVSVVIHAVGIAFPSSSTAAMIADKASMFFLRGYGGYFMLGYFLASRNLSRRSTLILYVSGAAGVLATIILTAYRSVSSGVPASGWYDYLSPFVALTAAALFVLFRNIFSERKFSGTFSRYVVILSNASFGAYLVHDLFIKFMSYLGFTSQSFNAIFSVPLITLSVALLSYAVSFALSKIPVINKFIV